MPNLFLISLICYTIVALIFLAFGVIYLMKKQFMPYHSQALGSSWSELDSNLQVLILALMKVAGSGFLVTGLTMLLLLIIPWRAGESWSIYAVPSVSLVTCLASVYATSLVKTQTSGKPPIVLSLVGVFLTGIGFIFSMFATN
ncbi:hypothetical protein PCC7418_2606 [Halothece sp. PCC 7418]|uniref:hypothetical protein n=1 Tax=Halothece sp. (strain PCC 7418) TaxID=65093 RepID=UPI0002A0802F|nr:hypothetical protein [Halothece sp. PCC 7418]AFZ44748.1 hypothetical protein PCC7418_2606 [Halothece sp. PCC 7418]